MVSYLEYATVEIERRSVYDDLGVDAGKGVWGFMADGEGVIWAAWRRPCNHTFF